MELTDLYTKRATAWEAAKKFLDTHRTEDGTMSAEDGKTYDRMEKEITDLTSEIERSERLAEMEKKLKMPTSQPITSRPGAGADNKPLTGRASHQYAMDFLAAMRTNFHQVSNVLEEGNDANGGYLVPEEWDSRLIDKLSEENIFRGLATTITTSGEHKINVAATKPAAAWIEEGEALTFGDATFDQVILDAHKLHVAIKITEELLYDNAFGLENYVIDQFGKALGNAEEDVSISRARDYLFIVMPDDNTENITNLRLVRRVEQLTHDTDAWNEFLSPDLEDLMFGDPKYLENNAFSTSHQSVNVYGLPEKCYEVRTEDTAVDVQIYKGASRTSVETPSSAAENVTVQMTRPSSVIESSSLDENLIPKELRKGAIDLPVRGAINGWCYLVPYTGKLKTHTIKKTVGMFVPQMRNGQEKMVSVSVVEEDRIIYMAKDT